VSERVTAEDVLEAALACSRANMRLGLAADAVNLAREWHRDQTLTRFLQAQEREVQAHCEFERTLDAYVQARIAQETPCGR
jgi:hypothetical protein